jgi:hypothetical protein
VAHDWQPLFYTFIGDGEDTCHDVGIRCYTDGSWRERGSSSGVAAYRTTDPETIFTSSKFTGIATVFQAELYAIQMACAFAMAQQDHLVIILSDSQSAIQALDTPLITSRAVLREELCVSDECLFSPNDHAGGPDGL